MATEAPNLTVVQGGVAAPSDKKIKKTDQVGSKEWASKKREEAKAVAREVDTVYMKLAQILYEVYDTPIDGVASNKPIYTAWGFESFQDYAEKELGLHYKKAFSLRKIWYRLEVELKDLEGEMRQRIVNLGWTKVRELVRVLTLKNAEKWVEYSESHTLAELTTRVGDYIKAAEAKKKNEADGKVGSAVAGASFGGSIDPLTGESMGGAAAPAGEPSDEDDVLAGGELGPSDVPSSGDGKDIMPLDGEDDDIPMDVIPEPTQLERRTFAFYPEQKEIVEQALALAEKNSKSDVPSNNLTLICMEFLATNNAMSRSEKKLDWKLRMLATIEQVLGLDLIAVDPGKNEMVYGMSTLTKIAGPEN